MTADLLARAMGLVLLETLGLVLIVVLADRLLPERWVRERHDLSLAAYLLVPVLMAVTLMPAARPQPESRAAASLADPPPAVVAAENVGRAASAATAAPPRAVDGGGRAAGPGAAALITKLVVLAWALGAAIGLGRIVADLRGLRRIVRRAQPEMPPPGLRLSRAVAIRRSSQIASPMLAGYLRPVILVPRDLRLDEAARPVLEHEIAHARRADNSTTLALRLIRAVFWWNAPLRMLDPAVASAREQLCDAQAVRVTGAPGALAAALLDTAHRAVLAGSDRLAAHARGHAGEALAARLRLLTHPDGAPARRPLLTLAVFFPALTVTAVLAAPSIGVAGSGEVSGDRQATAAGPARWDELELADAGYRDDGGHEENDALYRAAKRGDRDAVMRMLDAGHDPSAAAYGDGTPLMGAVRGGYGDIVEMLLARGADPDVPSPGDGTALIVAARQGDLAMVERLLRAGADPGLGVSGDGNPLIVAAREGEAAIVERLLEAGADVNAGVRGDGNALIGASLAGEADMVRRLIAAGAHPDGYVYGDETPLVNAAQVGRIDIAEILVAAGADVSLTVRTPFLDEGGGWRSPLSEARRGGHVAMEQWLLARNAEHRPGSD